MIGILVWLAVGALIGWVASLVMRSAAPQNAAQHIAVGVAGAIAGGCAGRLLGIGQLDRGDLSVAGLALCLIGAIVALGVFSLFHRPSQAR
ncbi:GlsB/YeaQ/YmgE family stress response membrane protein [Lysobacter sp. BMK333-48F3]|uniref:GlsB/YeaQ/YmgE family stress response membrane protein n=1 Tax=Lysobacter sp. BMK333-48F3 TaxID=2867962 RepID=UPI001C8C3988|nr:GlsB/YeaQ/YmgE family stress response membrane protein [Lysobacter sp. BMK333-48F3]MBX9403147.1 GlsB/YeaQ/YmgE family stress response membrane protein [Lysobacter sp. BMK333-48F3]